MEVFLNPWLVLSVANDGRGNCVAGFVNDMEDFSNPITEDFYLQSHGAIQGSESFAFELELAVTHFNQLLDRVTTL